MVKVTAKMVKELRDRTSAGMMDCKNALVKANGDIEKAVDILRENGAAKAAKKAGRTAAEGLANFAIDGNDAVLVEINSETDFVATNDKFVNFVNGATKALLAAKPADVKAALQAPMEGSTIGQKITDLTAVIGEKITLRRFDLLHKNDDEVFGAYKHNGGQIVALVTMKGGNEEAAKNIAMHVAAINPDYLNKDSVPAAELKRQKDVFTKETENEGKPAKIVPMIVKGRVNKYLSEICLVDQPYVKDDKQTVAQYAKSEGGEVVGYARYQVGEGIAKKKEDFAAEVAEQMK